MPHIRRSKRSARGLKQVCIFLIVYCPLVVFTGLSLSFEEEHYCTASLYTPVLNRPDFELVFGGADGKTVMTDGKGLVRALEFIAFPDTLFKIIHEIQKTGYSILEVKTPEYVCETPLYIDSRFVAFKKEKPLPRPKPLLSIDKITASLNAMEGRPYMWGGNYCNGIEQMLEFYPPSGTIPAETISLWILKGVDCSGLIYQASGGYTPRNTSSMLNYGKGLEISGLSAEKISNLVMPLDLIVWLGHVVLVLDADTVIESSQASGVVKSNLVARLRSIMSERTPSDKWDSESGKIFVIRRWHEKQYEIY
jgi:hypothetical protein